jgi:outer membrane protein assembly factor BamE (lipoprotein component of BamABCDE complex)
MRAIQILLILMLSACSTSSGNNFNVANVGQLQSGITDKTTIMKLLGQPTNKQITPDNETWIYQFSNSTFSPNPLMFVPVVQIVTSIPNNEGTSTSSMKILTLTFKGNILSTCSLMTNETKQEGLYSVGNTVTQTANCGGN